MEQYRTEEEQLEALRSWWNENGRSTVAAIIIALSAGFGWQYWQGNEVRQQEGASDIYQALLRVMGTQQEGAPEYERGVELAEQLKADYSGTTYAQFAALQLAARAVNNGKLPEAESQLRWALGKAAKGSDIAQVAQLRLARVLAASGDTEQALVILADTGSGDYAASYAAARGDILLAAGRNDEAMAAYSQALAGGGERLNLVALQQKLQSLMPVPAQTISASASVAAESNEAEPAITDTVLAPEE